jgi:hypothetical protein
MKPNDTARPETPRGFDKTNHTKGRSMEIYQENAESSRQTKGQNARENGKRGWSGKRGRKNLANRSIADKKTALGRRTVS